jgi:DNA-binding PadR family transcriptional regulator/polyisoprenoid-binding protein YceI
MDDGTQPAVTSPSGSSRFELAPPRRFVLPAILLLLSERPGYGYGLVPRLREFHFGHVDRPAVYRALAQLESDGLVEAGPENPTAGTARRVYRITALGERVLRVWMGVIKDEHDYLGEALRRYQATGTIDAVLAEVDGGWATALGSGWSAVSATSTGRRQVVPLVTVSLGDDIETVASAPEAASSAAPGPTAATRRYRLVPERSVVLIEVRSTVGPLSFGALGVTGFVEAAITCGVVRTGTQPSGRINIDVSGLRSGNGLYDAELLRRIDARRFPTATVELCKCDPSGIGSRYNLEGALTFHGATRPVQGALSVEAVSESRLLITGEQAFDIRDFAIPSPTVLMLRIYPDVRVQLQAEAELEDTR